MKSKVTNDQIKEIAQRFGIEGAALKAFIEVESGGKGFDSRTGKILIQFEPHWFKRKVPYAPSGNWSVNKVDVQSKEWPAFNEAFRINADGAMESTSIGLGQLMGFHYKIMGYKSVGEMWDYAKLGEYEQVVQLCIFLKNYLGGRILRYLSVKDWHNVAVYYNGSGYMTIAKKYGREPYNISMQKAYEKYKKLGW
ncbi:N-acetylmuramidase domain-containing protein [Sphingobacterium spiritivorum]|uniref:N-acetylmuramidase domain-containing protein n=1 Tax=Sphingobacterium spiritivorum TaxID=258 RepID=UPI003DA6C36E